MERWRVQPGAPKLEIETRDDGDERPPDSFRGYATVYGARTVVFWSQWVEVMAEGAFDASLARDVDRICTLWQHDSSEPLGRVSAGTMRVWSDDVGVGYSCKPPDSAMNRMESIARGDVHQSSIGFDAIEEEWAWLEEEDLWLRTIHEGGMWEGSPVTWPAVKETVVSVRGQPEFRGVKLPQLPADLEWREEAGRMIIGRRISSPGADLGPARAAARAAAAMADLGSELRL